MSPFDVAEVDPCARRQGYAAARPLCQLDRAGTYGRSPRFAAQIPQIPNTVTAFVPVAAGFRSAARWRRYSAAAW